MTLRLSAEVVEDPLDGGGGGGAPPGALRPNIAHARVCRAVEEAGAGGLGVVLGRVLFDIRVRVRRRGVLFDTGCRW